VRTWVAVLLGLGLALFVVIVFNALP